MAAGKHTLWSTAATMSSLNFHILIEYGARPLAVYGFRLSLLVFDSFFLFFLDLVIWSFGTGATLQKNRQVTLLR